MKRSWFCIWAGSHVALVVMLGVALMLWGSGCGKPQILRDGYTVIAEIPNSAYVAPTPEPEAPVVFPVAAEPTITRVTVYFDFDSDNLKPQEAMKLDAILHGNSVLKIDGHACVWGTSGYNIGLGLARANRAREYLGRGDVNSYGEEMCRAQCVTIDEADCQQCRKVEVRIQ